MPLAPEIFGQIRSFVRRGFETREQIVEIFCEEIYEPGELDEAEVAVAVDAAFVVLEEEKASWPEVTDCDRLDRTFAALEGRGVIALQNSGLTQSDGYGDVWEIYDSHPERAKIIGYCFYHGQDLERAVNGEGLYLAFGPMDPKQEQVEGPRVGAVIVEELARTGFSPEWNGTFATRIHIPKIDWKRSSFSL
jgi:hypothetical protein